MAKIKERLDIFLVKNGFFDSRQKAKAEIICGNVLVNSKVVDKPGTMIDINSKITVNQRTMPYVSRGGLKLEKALNLFDVKIKDKVALDAGASTGGFTDCLLKFGAKKVYAVDVGYGQLAYSLRKDKRVIVLERKNVRYLSPGEIEDIPQIITADLSFISLSKVFHVFYKLLHQRGDLIVLIKPQFEVGREEVGKKGVVKDIKLHIKAIKKIIDDAKGHDLYIKNLTFSPIKGPKGNIEFLAHFRKDCSNTNEYIDVDKIVKQSHLELF